MNVSPEPETYLQRLALGFAYIPGSIRVTLSGAELLVDELDPASGVIAIHAPVGGAGELTIEHQRPVSVAPEPLVDQTLGTAEQCIYCGATSDLRKEHIIPYALQGEFVIRNGSCAGCAALTGRFEERILRGAWLPVRIALGLRTRSPRRS
jgi:hypothetical protein